MVAAMFIFIAGLTGIFSKSNDGLLIGLLLSTVSGCYLIREGYKDICATKLKRNKYIDITQYDKGHITLNKRSGSYATLLSIDADRDITFKDNPAELVYTSATVGGITTGGFHVNPATRTETVGGKTGGYGIYLRTYDAGGTRYVRLKKILIQPDMLQSAKDHPVVSKYLDGDKINLESKAIRTIPSNIRSAVDAALKQHRWDIAAKLSRPYLSYVTKEECKAIIAWLTDSTGDAGSILNVLTSSILTICAMVCCIYFYPIKFLPLGIWLQFAFLLSIIAAAFYVHIKQSEKISKCATIAAATSSIYMLIQILLPILSFCFQPSPVINQVISHIVLDFHSIQIGSILLCLDFGLAMSTDNYMFITYIVSLIAANGLLLISLRNKVRKN